MSGVFRFLRKAFGLSKTLASATKPGAALQNATFRDLTRFAEGDRVLIDGAKLTFPLQKNAKFDLGKGNLQFNDVIGKSVTSAFVRSSKGSLHKVELPTLEEYVTLTPRLVTPVYASYASTIVSLLDIQPVPYTEGHPDGSVSAPRIEILEAGTGHGSLTLHLARAIAAANPPPPIAEPPKVRKVGDEKSSTLPETQDDADSEPGAITEAWTQWKQSRQAVLHTIEAVPSYSIHAEKVVRGFRRGLYWPHVDFHTGDVKDWVAQHLEKEESLHHVILDMPGVHNRLAHVSPAMRDDAKLIVFVPSVTQIADCLRVISEQSLPLKMVKVLELGEGISNGRKWDVRFVMPRKGRAAATNPMTEETVNDVPVAVSDDTEDSTSEESSEEQTQEDQISEADVTKSAAQDQQAVMVCRPLVGERTFGGGFIALFRKESPASAALATEWRQTQSKRARKRKH